MHCYDVFLSRLYNLLIETLINDELNESTLKKIFPLHSLKYDLKNVKGN